MSLLHEQYNYAYKYAISTGVGVLLLVSGLFLLPGNLPYDADSPDVEESGRVVKIASYTSGAICLIELLFTVLLIVGLKQKNTSLIRAWVVYNYTCSALTGIAVLCNFTLLVKGLFAFALVKAGFEVLLIGKTLFLASIINTLRKAQLSESCQKLVA